MNNVNSELLSKLEELAIASEQYYKWSNQYDLRIEDKRLRTAISNARELVNSIKNSN